MMRRRAQSAPLTEEDLEAWGQVCERFRPGGPCYWYEATRAADRRAADLMFMASDIAKYGPCAIQLFGIDCRGWSEEPDWTDRVRASPP